MTETIVVRTVFGPRLERRRKWQSVCSGERFREEILAPALARGPVHLDFSGMEMVSGSALDEAIGGMVIHHPRFAEHIETDLTYSADSHFVRALLEVIPLHIKEARAKGAVEVAAA